MIQTNYADPHPRERIYLDFRDSTQPARAVASTRVVSEHPLITVDVDEMGEPIGVLVQISPRAPEEPNSISNITRV